MPTSIGLEAVFDVCDPLPLRGFPEGKARLRLRPEEYAQAIIRTPTGVRMFFLKEVEGHWEPAAEIGANLDAERAPSVMGKYVTATIKGEEYPLQGWVIAESPLRIKCCDGEEHDCEGTPHVVINPPERPAAAAVNASKKFERETIVETLRKLPEVTWDRFAGDAEHVSVFGWIPRDDGKADFALVLIDADGPWLISTSSAMYSAEFSARLGMKSDGHTDCRRVEDHWPEVRCVKRRTMLITSTAPPDRLLDGAKRRFLMTELDAGPKIDPRRERVERKPVGYWTPVSEAMPDDEITVLVWVESLGDATLAYHDSEVLARRGDSGWVMAGATTSERVLLGVTHWCREICEPDVTTEAREK